MCSVLPFPLDQGVLFEADEPQQVENDGALGERFQQLGIRTLLQDPLASELGKGVGQLPLQPLLLGGEMLELLEPLGVVAAVGGGQQQPGELAAGVAPGLEVAAGGRVLGRPLEERGLAALDHAGDGCFPFPDSSIGGLIAAGHVERDRNQSISGERQLGQIIQRLGLGSGGQQEIGQLLLHVHGLLD